MLQIMFCISWFYFSHFIHVQTPYPTNFIIFYVQTIALNTFHFPKKFSFPWIFFFKFGQSFIFWHSSTILIAVYQIYIDRISKNIINNNFLCIPIFSCTHIIQRYLFKCIFFSFMCMCIVMVISLLILNWLVVAFPLQKNWFV